MERYEEVDTQTKIGPAREVEVSCTPIVNVPIQEPDNVKDEEEGAIDEPGNVVHPIRGSKDEKA